MSHADSTGLLRDPNAIFDEALNHPNSDSSGRGRGNAFQHCFASCMMAAENGGAMSFAAGHAWEAVNNAQGQSSADWAMDVNNNRKGREFGNSCPSRNRTSFDSKKSKDISKSCASSCSSANLTVLDF